MMQPKRTKYRKQMKGRNRGASSAVIDGKLTAFEIAPRNR